MMMNSNKFKKAEVFNGKLISKDNTHYYWNHDESKVIYKHDIYDEKKEYILVDILSKTQRTIFADHCLLNNINKYIDKPLTNLNMDIREFNEDHIIAMIEDKIFKITLDNHVEKLECKKNVDISLDISPDEKFQIIIQNHNLFIKDSINNQLHQLTFDGNNHYRYGRHLPYLSEMLSHEDQDFEQDVYGQWSKNSKYFITQVLDINETSRMPILQSCPKEGNKPKIYNPVYPCGGDEYLPKGYICIINTVSLECKVLKENPLDIHSYGGRLIFDTVPCWFNKEADKFYYVEESRGTLCLTLRELDLVNGSSKTILHHQSNRRLINCFEPIIDQNLVLNICDRSGYLHIYLYDFVTGKLINQVTSGEYCVEDIIHIDTNNQIIYFIAYGKENCNPYYEMLYRVNYDGSDLVLLTPEHEFHQISLSPDHKYFIDQYSTVNHPDKYLLRELSSGKTIIQLKEIDITRLLETGWKATEEFIAKGRDGVTDIYCNIYRPTDFNPDNKYPIIEHIYAGAWGYMVPKSFNGNTKACAFSPAYKGYYEQSLAELGFIVVTIDGFGTNCRGNEFQDYSYKKVQDSGLPDRISAMKQMADRYSYIDLDRVGIFGASCGGYDTVNALLTYPDFYKVGVSCSGVHDWRLDKAIYVEPFIGYPDGDYYDESSNISRANQLQGKLLLAHGELDDNVHPSNTFRLAKALVEHHKDFDMFIMPGVGHSVLSKDYFQKKMWCYFINNLLNNR